MRRNPLTFPLSSGIVPHMHVPLLLSMLALAACAPETDTDTADSAADTAEDTAPADVDCATTDARGTLAVSFRMEEDYLPSMDLPPVGTFRGSVFSAADVSGVGPADGSVAWADLLVEGVDLSAEGGPTAVLSTTDPLPACQVSLLGCLDLEGDGCGDSGDPVTLPNQSLVTVVADTETAYEVYFGLLAP